MSNNFDPSAFADPSGESRSVELPTAGDVDGVGDDDRDGDGDGDGGTLGTDTLRDMLLSTEPAEPLSAVESPWDPERGGPVRIKRGIRKMFGVDGSPAVEDLILGVVETVDGMDVDDGEPGDGDGEESDADGDDGSML
jgi:hypothetical protein